jgi:8-oxo-dGTP diphosphatase
MSAEPAAAPRRLVVAAAVIERAGAFLVTRRLAGTHLEGCWEFPGGKCDDGESHAECLVRELREELDAGIRIGAELLAVSHAYPDRLVELHFFSCELTSEPRALLGQEMQWVRRADLGSLVFPAADADLIRLLTSKGASA